jgi:L-amino acid N-acyltransferase YncA
MEHRRVAAGLQPRRTPDVIVRPARRSDAAGIARIYSLGIEERIATFETEPRTTDDMLAYLAEREGRYPVIVAEQQDGQVVAWAAAGPYRSRDCYSGVCEFSVYADRAARGSGAAQAALQGLIDACEDAGFWKLVSRIFPENGPSRGLCRKVGFREVGVYYRHARLEGEWRDTVIVERLLGEAAQS